MKPVYDFSFLSENTVKYKQIPPTRAITKEIITQIPADSKLKRLELLPS